MDNLNFLYQEYVRLNTLVDSYASSSFSDFQLLGVVGVMLAWEPFANRWAKIRSEKKSSAQMVFLGFVAIFLVIAIIATRDLMKQSIIAFEISQISHYEQAIRKHASFDLLQTFNSSNEWKAWLIKVHGPISNSFRIFLIAIAVLFPALVLWKEERRYTYWYLGIITLIIFAYVRAVLILKDGIGI